MRPLVRLYGAEKVNDAGLSAFGFPGVLCECPHEVEAIRKELSKNK
jgi:hypothetical protein